MALEAYTLDQLHRLLTLSKWALIVSGGIFLILVVVNQWAHGRISTLQQEQTRQTEQQLRASRAELSRTKAQTNELSAELSRFVAPRSLPEDQIDALRKCLSDGPRGPVVMAFLKTEADAEPYATQIAKVLTETGYEV